MILFAVCQNPNNCFEKIDVSRLYSNTMKIKAWFRMNDEGNLLIYLGLILDIKL